MATKRPITELDFQAIKTQLKTYLRGQTQFKDYDFDGSNMSVLLDLLAYNTYQNNFYTNMAISEMFLDTALRENSVLSHAKELNYLPNSAKSAKAVVNLRINSSVNSATISIPKNTKFTTNYLGQNYNFYTDSTCIATKVATNTFEVTGMEIFEGFLTEETFLIDVGFVGFTLSNPNVDISSLKLLDEDSNEWLYRSDIFGVEPGDRVFYLEPSLDGNYTITFGRDIFGKQPDLDFGFTVSYRICSTTGPNGASRFTSTFLPSVSVTTMQAALGGAEKESLESIKYFAPKSIQIQERAVTTSDYQVLLKQRFPDIKSVSVIGGDELEPPQYGKVAIAVNLKQGGLLSNSIRNQYKSYLLDKTPLSISPVFLDTQFLYTQLEVDVYYSTKFTNKTKGELVSLVRAAIQSYSDNELEDFGATLRISRLSSVINEVDPGILSNNIQAKPIIEYAPAVNTADNPSFNFRTTLATPYPFNTARGFTNYKPSVTSNNFVYRGINVFLNDDGLGKIQAISGNISSVNIVNPSIGTVDYSTGLVRLSNFIVSEYDKAIKIIATPSTADIISPKDRVISIRSSDININLIEQN